MLIDVKWRNISLYRFIPDTICFIRISQFVSDTAGLYQMQPVCIGCIQFASDKAGLDQKKRKEIVEIFLLHAEELQIDLHLKDENDKTGFDYLPQDLKNELNHDILK